MKENILGKLCRDDAQCQARLSNGSEKNVYWVGPMCGGVAAAFVYDFLLYPKTESFPERMRVLVSGPPTDYDVNGRDDVPAVEMSSK
ncbi:aquaporin 1 [Silurus asotus]|uniref:Aquaporin 1 n=1 Tax=Silurus asotus TaxID=30991 RepID=A0AAD5APE4_SILAS|nr:aquaporin 1 [Silurus asotus]